MAQQDGPRTVADTGGGAQDHRGGSVPDDDRYQRRQPRATRHRQAGGPVGDAPHRRGPYAPRRAADVPAVLLRPTSPRREFLVPSSVILAGVLAVLAVAITVNWGMRRAETPAALAPTVGAQPLAPADEWSLPTPTAPTRTTPAPTAPRPTASATPTVRPTSPAPGRSDARPPSRSRVEAPPANAVAISRSAVPAAVDLSAEGRQDWVHWGLDGTFSLERRRNGGFAILEGTPTAPRHRHALSRQRFRWNDGTTVAGTSGTPSGIRTCGARNGFTLSVPADTRYRTLRLYVGVAEARGRLHARLSTGGAPVTGTLDSRQTLDTSVFTVTYRAPKKAKLKVSWVTEKSYDSSCGGVALQAATLR
jgi:hypothetical protein